MNGHDDLDLPRASTAQAALTEEAQDASARPRCARHQLILPPDGVCVLCRREAVGARGGMWSQLGLGQLVAGGLALTAIALAAVAFLALGGFELLVRGAETQGLVRGRADAQATDIAVDPAADPGEPTGNVRDRMAEKARVAEARRSVSVVFYSANACDPCTLARSYFQANDIFFDERNVDDNADYAAERDALSPGAIPVLTVDGDTLVGWESPTKFQTAFDDAVQARLEP